MIVCGQLWALLRYFDRVMNRYVSPYERICERAHCVARKCSTRDSHRTNHQNPCRTETVAPVLCEWSTAIRAVAEKTQLSMATESLRCG